MLARECLGWLESLPSELKKLREASGLSQAAFAKRAKVVRCYITHFEARRRWPSYAVIRRILLAMARLQGSPPR